MKFRMQTLIDITETGARRGDNDLEYGQQCNYNTVIQTIGLKANPLPVAFYVAEQGVGNMGFGSTYKGKNRVWVFDFEIEYKDVVSIETLTEDFDLIPVITGLNETINLNASAFRTKDPELKNTIFKLKDKYYEGNTNRLS